MPTGNCRLCGVHGELQDSHLLPNFTYKRMRKASELAGDNNTNPVIITPEVTVATSKQVKDYLLCHACEQEFSSKGEKWIAENCWQAHGSFPLRDALQAAQPISPKTAGVNFYEAAKVAGIDTEKLVYFAASVFWRAAAHAFGPIMGQKPQKLSLGPYESPLRDFLLGASSFPNASALLVTVSSSGDDETNQFSLFPFLRSTKMGGTEYAFVVPGIAFQLFVGKSLDAGIAALSLAHTDHRIIAFDSLDGMVKDAFNLLSKSKKMRL